MALSDVVMVSNRGPLSFGRDQEGNLVAKPGAGGLVSSVSPLLAGTGATWVAAAVSEDDRAAAAQGLMASSGEQLGLKLVACDIDPDDYRMAYAVVSNATLWYVHHGLFDLARRPRFDRRWQEAWEGYRALNTAFADAVERHAPTHATVLVQDYHLSLVGELLSANRHDLRLVHFSHTPFATPDGLRVLPDQYATQVLKGMSANSSCGFHSARWAGNFQNCCGDYLGVSPRTFVAPLGPDPNQLKSVAASTECRAERDKLHERVGDRAMVLRVDRVELSKNILRGFLAFDQLLTEKPQWRQKVVFVAMAYASRQGLADYLAYRNEVENLVARINEKWACGDWEPILLDVDDNYPRSVAALSMYDVLLVNPIRDGLNLVAKEGPLINDRHGLIAVSREAGVWDEVAPAALEINPFDVSGTAEVLFCALDMSGEERRRRVVHSRPPAACPT